MTGLGGRGGWRGQGVTDGEWGRTVRRSGTGGNGQVKRDRREVGREKRQPKAKVAVVTATVAPVCPHRRGVELAVTKVTVTVLTDTFTVTLLL